MPRFFRNNESSTPDTAIESTENESLFTRYADILGRAKIPMDFADASYELKKLMDHPVFSDLSGEQMEQIRQEYIAKWKNKQPL